MLLAKQEVSSLPCKRWSADGKKHNICAITDFYSQVTYCLAHVEELPPPRLRITNNTTNTATAIPTARGKNTPKMRPMARATPSTPEEEGGGAEVVAGQVVEFS